MQKLEFFIKEAYANLIPPLPEKDFQRLKKSISEFGLNHPIVINRSHVVLDGHHRLQACHELNIPVSYQMKDFSDPIQELKFVLTMNVNTRHLSEFQRAQVAIRFKKLYADNKKEANKNRMQAWYFTKATGKQAAIRRWHGDTGNLIEECQSIFG